MKNRKKRLLAVVPVVAVLAGVLIYADFAGNIQNDKDTTVAVIEDEAVPLSSGVSELDSEEETEIIEDEVEEVTTENVALRNVASNQRSIQAEPSAEPIVGEVAEPDLNYEYIESDDDLFDEEILIEEWTEIIEEVEDDELFDMELGDTDMEDEPEVTTPSTTEEPSTPAITEDPTIPTTPEEPVTPTPIISPDETK